MRNWLTVGVPLMAVFVTALVAVAALAWWLRLEPKQLIETRVPTAQDVAEARRLAESLPTKSVNIEGQFNSSTGRPSALAGTWPRFRGSDMDNVGKDGISLAETWPEGGPAVLWTVKLGDGHGGAAVMAGRVFVLDYDVKAQADCLRCISLDDGTEIWRRWYDVQVKQNHGMSRTVPAVSDKWVVTIGPRCHVMCVDMVSGNFKWGLDLVKDFGTIEPLWYTGQCPLIDGSNAVVAPAGRDLLIGVDCETGNIAWRTPNPRGWKMSHSSIVPATIAGKRMYIYAAAGGIAGVSAEESDRGALLWETTDWNHAVVSPSPVSLGDGRIFMTSGYGAGSCMLKVTRNGESFSVATLFKLDRKVFACEQHTPVFYDGALYSVLPNDAEEMRRQLVCMNPDGRVLWASGKENRFGLGPYLIADRKMFVLDDQGVLTLARADAAGYKQLARAKVLDGHDSWGPMALVDGRLILRDSTQMVCVDVAAGK